VADNVSVCPKKETLVHKELANVVSVVHFGLFATIRGGVGQKQVVAMNKTTGERYFAADPSLLAVRTLGALVSENALAHFVEPVVLAKEFELFQRETCRFRHPYKKDKVVTLSPIGREPHKGTLVFLARELEDCRMSFRRSGGHYLSMQESLPAMLVLRTSKRVKPSASKAVLIEEKDIYWKRLE
jgi:hypothetical protein